MKKNSLKLVILLLAFTYTAFASKKDESFPDTSKTENSILLSKSPSIESVTMRKSKKKGNVIYITFGKKKLNTVDNNTTAIGMPGKSESKEAKNATGPLFDQIEVLNGGYDEIKVDKVSTSQNIYTIDKISFPLRLKMHSGKEYVEFEIKDAGRWDVDINYKNN